MSAEQRGRAFIFDSPCQTVNRLGPHVYTHRLQIFAIQHKFSQHIEITAIHSVRVYHQLARRVAEDTDVLAFTHLLKQMRACVD